MPITKKDAPDVLPDGAKSIFVSAFNAAYDDTCETCNDRDECASKIAWSAVKNKYAKHDGEWVPKAAIVEVSLTITKASVQKDGTMRWCATCSDTEPDGTGERTSLPLFRDWIERTESGNGVDFLPAPRVPFLGLSHYPDLDGSGEAGVTQKMYVDGKQFKAAGAFQADNPLGKALFEAVRSELEAVKKGGEIEQPIRISAAWWDLEHSHGNFVFARRSLFDTCPMCAEGTGGKQYLKGQLDHFAATRVPINPRTELGLEEKSMVTRKDDAASIVGDDLAEELEGKAKELVGKSETVQDGLVVKADEADPELSEHSEQPEPDSEPTEQKMYADEGEWKPMGGAMSFAEAEAYVEAQEKMDRLWTNWDIFDSAFMNIMNAPAEVDKVEATKKLVGEFNERVQAIKANVTDAFLVAQAMVSATHGPQPAKAQAVEGGLDMSEETTNETVEPQAEPETNDPASVLGAAVKAALDNGELTREGKLAIVQEALNSYAGSVKAELDAVAPPAPGEEVVEAIEKSFGALADKLDLLIAKLGSQPAQPSQVQRQLPTQKSYAPSGPVKPQSEPQLPVSPITGEPSTLRAMIERSVGMHQ
jgi:cation transport regulator ChaB